MNRTTLATRYRILTKGRNLLAHLLCLLLIVSTPALAQGTCGTNFILPSSAPSGQCVILTSDSIWDSRTLDEREISRKYEASSPNCGLAQTIGQNPPLLDTYLLGAGPPFDIGAVEQVGTNPATLRPESIDLEIFPSIKISDQLSLKPSLSYSEDVCMSRLGLVHYGAPKGWRNHYGELVVMLAGTVQSRTPLNKADISNQTPEEEDPLLPEVREIQLFFVNANGQQVNFYPDPAHFSAVPENNVDTPFVDIQYWYSGEGNYRLEDRNHGSTTTNTFNFELKTPTGLVYEFERYQVDLNADHESMALHYRVTKISDRYGNHLKLDYLDLDSIKDLRPETVKAYRLNQNATTAIPVLLHTLNYTYLPDGRLSSVDMPGYGNSAARNFYHFYYPDTGSIHPGMPGRHTLSNAASENVALYSDNQSWRAVLEPLKTDIDAYLNPNTGKLWFDFEDLGFAPEPMVDYDTPANFDFTDFASAGYGFAYEYVSSPQKGFAMGNTSSRQAIQHQSRYGGHPGLEYRFQIDNYPNNIVGFSDNIRLSHLAGDPFTGTFEAVDVDVYPMLKDGDAIVWVENNQLKSLEVKLGDGDSISATDYSVKLGSGDTPSGSPANVRLVREDNRARIAEIQFPTSPGSSHKRMLFEYDDRSVNHQEIKKVQIFDVNQNDALLLAETYYE